MLRHLGFIAVCACTVVSVGCDGGLHRSNHPTATAEFRGRIVNADTGDPVGNVRVSVEALGLTSDPGFNIHPEGWVMPRESATSGGDGTFTLQVSIPSNWTTIDLNLTGPGYEGKRHRFDRTTAFTRPDIRMYPALVIRPGESIEVRVEEGTPNRCAFGSYPCRSVLVDASSGEPVELEIMSDDASKPMGLAADPFDEETVLRLVVEPGEVVYVYGTGTARLTARR